MKKMINAIVKELQKRWAEEGNGCEITMKRTGKVFCVWIQNPGTYQITDKRNIWMKETYCKTFNTLEELAEEIMSL